MTNYRDPLSRFDYVDKTHYRKELSQLFHGGWHLVAFVFELPSEGDFQVVQLGEESIILINEGGHLSAFLNVCRHRGHPLLEGNGNQESITCPYHQWHYGLSGELIRAPNERRLDQFRKESICLHGFSVKVLGDLVFINLAANPEPLNEEYAVVAEKINTLFGDTKDLCLRKESHYDIESNWKVVLDNYLECYHCGTGHKSFCQVMKLRSYEGKLGDDWSYQEAEYCGDLELPEDAPQHWAFFTLYPSMIINVTPGLRQLNLMQVVPLSETRTRVLLRTWSAEVMPAALTKLLADTILEVKTEDVAYCEQVQRGMVSSFFERGYIMADEKQGPLSERSVLAFHQWLVGKTEA